jgi:hypothetical protein
MKFGLQQVVCKLSTTSVPIGSCTHFKLETPDPKTFYAQQKYENLVYAIFFIIRFQDCLVKLLKEEPEPHDARLKGYFKKTQGMY